MTDFFFADLPSSFMDLMNTAIATSPESSRYQQIVGAITILLSAIVCKQDSDLFRGLMREVAQTVSVASAKQILSTAQMGLTEAEGEWLKRQIGEILEGE